MKKMKKLHLLLAALLFTLLIPVCKPTTIQAATLKAPKTLTVKQGRNNISVQWSKVSGAKGYVVYRKNSPSQGWKRLKVVKAPTVKYLDKNIASGKSYYYTVRPYTSKSGKNSYGSYNKSGRNTIYLKEPKVKATKSATSVTLKWNKTTGASGYEVYRKSDSSGYSKVKTTTALSYKDTAVEPNTKYTYAVRAYKKSGSSVFRSLYYDNQNLVSVKTHAEVQDPVEPDPEPSVPDINDVVESKVYVNEFRNIIEVQNKSNSSFKNVGFEIFFYDALDNLVYKTTKKELCSYLGPHTSDFMDFGLSKKFQCSYYKTVLSCSMSAPDNSKLIKDIRYSEIYLVDNYAKIEFSNTGKKNVWVTLKFISFDSEKPVSVYLYPCIVNLNETIEISLPAYIKDAILNKDKVITTIHSVNIFE